MRRETEGPTMPPVSLTAGRSSDAERSWRQIDSSSVNAVSFGFVATAILISMFLVMAIFERFLRPRSGDGDRPRGAHGRRAGDVEARRRNLARKLDYPSPKMSIYAKGVSVLMPGNDIPTYIAHPAPPPLPCPPDRVLWPPHHHIPTADSLPSSS